MTFPIAPGVAGRFGERVAGGAVFEPMDIPLFPLRTVLFPGGALQLRIFEVRYLDMIGRCQRDGSAFGVVSLTSGSEVQRPAAPGAEGPAFAPESFHSVGTLAVIDALDRPQPGLMNIRCTGTHRFRVESRRRLEHGLWMGVARQLPDDPEVALPDDLVPLRGALRRIVDGFREQRNPPHREMPIPEPHRWDDCGWLANRWCDILPMSGEQKQRLMELESPLVRLELVGDLLERMRPSDPEP